MDDYEGKHVATVEVPTDQVTANAVISNPNVRRVITQVMGVVGALIAVGSAVDIASPHLDFETWTYPVAAGYTVFATYYGLRVSLPNIPKR